MIAIGLFPVRDSKLIRHLRDEILATCLADVAKARHVQPDGSYLRDANRAVDGALNSQQRLIGRAVARSSRDSFATGDPRSDKNRLPLAPDE